MNYGRTPKVCRKGCREEYREEDEDHNYAYHTPKTVALLCGCGYGDIFVSRMRKHLLEAHGIMITKPDVVAQYFWHRLPPYNVVRKCDDVNRVGCKFRTPIHELIENGHNCRRDMRVSELPEPDQFFDNMQNYRVLPVRGVPRPMRRTSRSPSPKRSKPLSAPTSKPNEPLPKPPSASSVAGRTSQSRRPERRPSHSASQKRVPSASPRRPKSSASRFEPRRKSREEEDSESEFSGSEHSADTRPKGTRKPSSAYDESETLELHPEEFSELEVEFTDEKRVIKQVESEWWGTKESAKPVKRITELPADMASKGAIGAQVPKPSPKRPEEKKQEQWQVADKKGKHGTASATPSASTHGSGARAKFEPNWDVFDKIITPSITPSTSTYAYRANLMREPDNFKMRGVVCYNTSSERTHNVHLYTETHMYAGTFVLINEEGTPFCYATVTPHVGSPYGNDSDRKWNQFNPLNYPCYAEIMDRRARPNQTFFYACFSVKVATGKFHMRSLPRDDTKVVIPIIFQKMKDFGKTSYVQYKDN